MDTTSLADDMHAVISALVGQRFPLEDEKATQAAIATAFASAGVCAEREVNVTGGRIDFVVPLAVGAGRGTTGLGIGVEIKIKGAAAGIGRQMKRYASDPGLAGLVLVTSKPVGVPAWINGKPVTEFNMARAWL